MITTLEDFIDEYSRIKERGWIRTHRSGPTGIGKTLEDLLGIPENNVTGPDFGDYELKSCRINSNSMLTMFTCAPDPKGANNRLREYYGYASGAYDNTEKVLHATLKASMPTKISDTGKSLGISCEDGKIYIVSQDGSQEAYWTEDSLRKKFEKKYKNKFVYAKAESRGKDEAEEFHFTEAYEVSGFDYNAVLLLIRDSKIFIDIRIGQYHGGPHDGEMHDHGTGFRIREAYFDLIFKNNNRIV